ARVAGRPETTALARASIVAREFESRRFVVAWAPTPASRRLQGLRGGGVLWLRKSCAGGRASARRRTVAGRRRRVRKARLAEWCGREGTRGDTPGNADCVRRADRGQRARLRDSTHRAAPSAG